MLELSGSWPPLVLPAVPNSWVSLVLPATLDLRLSLVLPATPAACAHLSLDVALCPTLTGSTME